MNLYALLLCFLWIMTPNALLILYCFSYNPKEGKIKRTLIGNSIEAI